MNLFPFLIPRKSIEFYGNEFSRTKQNSYENFFRILMTSNPVNHLAAIYPINPKKIEQIIGAIEPAATIDPTATPATDNPNADKLAKPD